VKRLLDNYTINARTRYEAHRLIYTPVNDEPIEFGGMLAASIFAALIVDTDEGDAREIALDTLDIDQTLITPDTELKRDIGITSVDAVAIASFTQKTFGCAIDMRKVKAIITLQDLYDYIEQNG